MIGLKKHHFVISQEIKIVAEDITLPPPIVEILDNALHIANLTLTDRAKLISALNYKSRQDTKTKHQRKLLLFV